MSDSNRDTSEPTESTRLLPSEGRGLASLSPDQVLNPYDAFLVRFFYGLTIALIVLSLMWWIIQILNVFVTLPGLYSPGGGFTSLGYTEICVISLILSLLFFSIPSTIDLHLCVSMACVAAFDLILIVASKRLRREEGLYGILTAVATVVVLAWTSIIAHMVRFEKQKQVVQLTEDISDRTHAQQSNEPDSMYALRHKLQHLRPMSEWFLVVISFLLRFLLLISIVLGTLLLILRLYDGSLKPEGDIVPVEDGLFNVHIWCRGNISDSTKKPVLFLESSHVSSEKFSGWADELINDGSIPGYCSWDRPGYAFSESAPSPFSAGRAADALIEALSQAGLGDKQLVIATAGIGSIYSYIFASRRPHSVSGILYVDGVSPDLFLREVGSGVRGLKLFWDAEVAELGIGSLFGWIFGGRTRQDRVYGRSFYHGRGSTAGKFQKALIQEQSAAKLLTMPELRSAKQLVPLTIPVSVISSEQRLSKDSKWSKGQKELADTGSLVSFTSVDAPHHIWESSKGRATIQQLIMELL
ncbi:hypothetical protein CANCADRAFT_56062 [Tortispora caseinolytica NRRL Y-17796]|uniref:AB hydrolase-1 domain-containing protein n=1 Tax=Tortispora caseinolytica NRRL Y-17796 TaxID=767744 RepID=A0A1E4TKX2_9ASCO|nr:hypothetical protein CANCADRAFT_56062 [Tortispora caseinolytica NRRL Y-17796]